MSQRKPRVRHGASSELIGKNFGEMKVLEFVGRDSGSRALYLCQCSCGSPPKAATCDALMSGQTKTCGNCLSWKDLTNETFDRWKVLSDAGKDENSHRRWLCQCSCGSSPKVVAGSSLLYGISRSCGCLSAEMAAARMTTHGMSGTPEYRCWRNMLNRCLLETATFYSHYGARGITVCERWQSFEAFIEDMGKPPSPTHEIERIDVNGNYEPSNCCWIPQPLQARNKRNNVKAEYKGKILCIAELAELPECLVSQQTISRRLARGWSAEKAITTPPANTDTPYKKTG